MGDPFEYIVDFSSVRLVSRGVTYPQISSDKQCSHLCQLGVECRLAIGNIRHASLLKQTRLKKYSRMQCSLSLRHIIRKDPYVSEVNMTSIFRIEK
jgi:hypothetical protein